MSGFPQCHPLTLALFQKRIDGDDWLMELARRRFHEARMGTEMYAGTPDELAWAMKFLPSADTPVTVHLARDFNVAEETSRNRIIDFATRFAGKVYGWVVHDRLEMSGQPEVFVNAARKVDANFHKIKPAPYLFIEYAAGLEPERFAAFFSEIQPLVQVSACIDIGHVGIWQARHSYRQMHSGEDVCALKWEPRQLPSRMADIETAVESAPPVVLNLIEWLGRCQKPVHFHLHDAHPLSTVSPFGVSDHLSFQARIPLDFEYRGQRFVPPMFGPEGLAQVVTQATQSIGLENLSFNLEIHPTPERIPLGSAAALFAHWRDKTNAEQTNHWLEVLVQNHGLLLKALNVDSIASLVAACST